MAVFQSVRRTLVECHTLLPHLDDDASETNMSLVMGRCRPMVLGQIQATSVRCLKVEKYSFRFANATVVNVSSIKPDSKLSTQQLKGYTT